jgi:hypothetical protein
MAGILAAPASMAESTARSRLPLEMWDQILGYLVPEQDVKLQPWRRTRDWKRYAPALQCTLGEDPALRIAVRALTDSPNLLFRGSRLRYWTILMQAATWRMEWTTDDEFGGLNSISKLGIYFRSSVRHVVVPIDMTVHDILWPNDKAEGSADMAGYILLRLGGIRSFTFRIKVEGEGAVRGDLLDCRWFRLLFGASSAPQLEGPAWNEALRSYWPREFRMVIQSFEKVGAKLRLMLEEDVTTVWALGLEETVEPYMRRELDAHQVEQLVKVFAENSGPWKV